MISKELFIKFLEQYQRFNNAFERIEEALMGKKYSSNLCESDWYKSMIEMLDLFLQSHFTEYGCDLINAYLFEDCREFWTQVGLNKTHYPFNTLEDLYNVMLKFREDYFLD